MDNEPDELSPRRRRLLFRARHRGTKETDLLVGGFVGDRIESFSEQELDEVEELLELQDADLTDWLTGRRPVPAELQSPMMLRLMEASAAPGAGLPEGMRNQGTQDI
ncbi:succinate dehydrogenase assembly factor 2 [Pararoseomonas indoligenes]|nr:succinate dehydrogenase assembly factor 2 [Pararoseomonas indoligenes]